MKREIDALRRIERLRRRMADLSAWRLAQLRFERGQLQSAHEDMLAALGHGLTAYGPPAAFGARRVRAVEQELAATRLQAEDFARKALDDQRLAKLAQDRLETVREAWRETQARKSLEELIEASVKGSRKP